MELTRLALVPFTAAHFATLAGWFASEREVVQWGGSAVRFPLDDLQLQAMTDEALTEPAPDGAGWRSATVSWWATLSLHWTGATATR